MGKQAADLILGPRRSEGGGSNTEERLRPTYALTEEVVWWAQGLSH